MPETSATRPATLPAYPACPSCHTALEQQLDQLTCASGGAAYRSEQGVPLLFADAGGSDDVQRVQAHYDHVAHEYDQVFASHVSRHYLDKRLGIVRRLLPRGGRVLDVGCGTGAL